MHLCTAWNSNSETEGLNDEAHGGCANDAADAGTRGSVGNVLLPLLGCFYCSPFRSQS